MGDNEVGVDAKPKTQRQVKLALLLATVVVLVSSLAITAYWFLQLRVSNGLPPETIQHAGFAVYYPEPLPKGYSLVQNTAHLDSGVLTYTIENRDRLITINEQSAPKNGPDFQAIQMLNTSYKPVDLPSRKALVGIDTPTAKPIAIISTNTTLMIINGSKNVPQDVMVALTKSMTSLAL